MENINISNPNDGLGDKVRDAFNKVNLNFTELDNGKEVKLLASDSTKYYRGDKSWQTLDKTAVGLNLVDNTADSNKPVSIPQQNALNLKLDLDLSTQANANALTGTETLFINQGGLPRKTTVNSIVGDYVLKAAPLLQGTLTKIESLNVDINSVPASPNIYAPSTDSNLVNGKNNQLNTDDNIIFGDNNQCNSGGTDFIIGSGNQINASNTLIFGKDNQSNAGDDMVVGEKYQNNLSDSFTVAFNSILSNDFDFRVSRTNGVEFGQLKGLGHQLIQLNKDGRAIGKGNKLVYINTKEDFLENGTKVGNAINLRKDSSYCVLGTVDLTGDRLVLENGSMFSFAPTTGAILSTGLGAEFIVSTKGVCRLDNFVIVGTGLNFGVQNLSPTGTLVINLVTVENTNIGLDVNGASNVLMNNSNFINSALNFSGTIGYILLNQNLFTSTTITELVKFKSSFISFDRVIIYDNDITQNLGLFSIQFEAGFTAGNERIQLKDNSFAGGTTILGLDAKDLRAVFKDNEGIQNGAVIANYYNINNAIATDIITANTPVKINSGTTILAPISNKFTHTNNRVTYVGAFAKDFVINATASVTGTTGHLLAFVFAKNGVVLNETYQPITINATNRAENVKVQGAVSLAPNDYLELWVANVNNNTDVTVTAYNVLVEAKN